MAELFEVVARFARDVKAEMKKVIWPDRRTTVAFTAAVLLATGAITAIIWIADLLLTKVFGLIFRVRA